MHDPFDLQRFVDAQHPVFDRVCAELAGGQKRSHWMWFIFPQIKGLGHSDMARRFALSSIEAAHAYLQHIILGPRLLECSRLVANVQGRSVGDIFGYPDNMKFHSSMTLFAQAAPDQHIFIDCLNKFFAGIPDQATVDQL